jgi:hypothetical protein
MKTHARWRQLYALNLVILVLAVWSAHAGASEFISSLHTVSPVGSTVPGNGDVNPYGVAVVPRTIGKLVAGNILVSNFNNAANAQGQGTTIVQLTPGGAQTLFAQLSPTLHGCPGGVGLTTALTVLKRGWVIVGSLPTSGTATPLTFTGAGCLIVLNAKGKVVETVAGKAAHIDGPWDMASFDQGGVATLFVTNVLNGGVTTGVNAQGNGPVVNAGTVIRLVVLVPQQGDGPPTFVDSTIIGSSFAEQANGAALIIGPTGLGFSTQTGQLYVADTLSNRIAAIPNARTRTTTAFSGKDVTSNGGLNQPLGMVIAPNGDVVTVNAADGNIIETTPSGAQFAPVSLIANGGGDLFGLVIAPGNTSIYFVNDGNNTLMLFH